MPQFRQQSERQAKVGNRHRQQKSRDQELPAWDERSHKELLPPTDSIIPPNGDAWDFSLE
jgi:hypothetical protein